MMFADDFDRLLEPYPKQVARLARQLHAEMMRIRPDYSAKVSFGWQTVNYSLPRRGFINALYLSRTGKVGLVFQDGRLLDSPLLVDDGKVKRVRWIPLSPGDAIPVDEIAILVAEAVALRG
jgi:hypothetical protein